MDTAIVLFTRDLRLHDNPALHLACARARQVVPLFVLDRAIAAPDHQVAATLAQGLAQVGEGFGQETGAVRRRGDGRVGHEQRHHLAGPGARRMQRRIIVQPKITGEDHDRGVHLPPPGHRLVLQANRGEPGAPGSVTGETPVVHLSIIPG